MLWRPLATSVSLLALAACMASTNKTPSSLVDGELVSRRDLLLAADLVPAKSPNVYEAILEVRPDFLWRPVLPATSGEPRPLRVYLDDLEIGGIDALRTLPLGPVTSVRYFDARAAAFRYGRQDIGGAILVTTAH